MSRPLSFHLTRLVWLGLLPLLAVAVGLVAYQVQGGLAEKRASAERRTMSYIQQLDGFLGARIQSLEMLASSPLADDPARWPDLYVEAQGYQRSFNSHVIFADAQRQMLFNTRVPFGTSLPRLPEAQKGRSAAPEALATGRPGVGDIVQGPVINQPLVAIVVPGVREGRVRHLMLVTVTTGEFQELLDALPLEPEWAITVRDSAGLAIARSAPAGFDSASDVDPDWRFTANSRYAPWTVSVEVPRSVVLQPLYASAVVLLVGIALATLVGVLGTRRLARHIERQALSMADVGAERPEPDIDEFSAARQRLDAQWGALSVSQARLQRLVDLPHAALAMLDRDMRYLAVSRRWYEDYDLGDGNIVGRSHYEVFPEIGQYWKEVHRRALAGEVVKADEDPFTRQNGTVQWLRWEVRPWHAADGSVGGIVIFSEDVTESRQARDALLRDVAEQKAVRLATLNQMEDANAARREAEAANVALSASESLYRAVFEAANVGKSVTRPNGEIQVNRAFCDMLGYSPEELRGKTWQELTPAEEIGPITDRLAPLLRGEQDSLRFEKRYLHKNGSFVWADISVAIQRDLDGAPQRFITTVVDISARKEAEQALVESEVRLRLALVAARQGLYDLKLQTGEVVVSPEYAAMLGHDPQGFLETHNSWRERLHPDDRTKVLGKLDDYLGGSLPEYRVEYRMRTRDGDWKWVLSVGKLLEWTADGRPARMLGTHTDIDALKAAESALRDINATLEARVAERTAELTAANRELETFAYAVSHDLRAPLRTMSGYSQALQEDYGAVLEDQAKTYLDHIARAAHTMSDLIDGLLALSRITRGEMRQDRVDVSALAHKRLSELAESEPHRRVVVDIEEGIVVQGDARMLASALVNLLDNAWKYTGAAEAPVIRVHASEAAGLCGFCVSDNGAGFDMDHAEGLFKPFQRLHRQDEFPGIGIGLATVQRIVHRHGGEIMVNAEPGKGARFCLLLPQGSVAHRQVSSR